MKQNFQYPHIYPNQHQIELALFLLVLKLYIKIPLILKVVFACLFVYDYICFY